MVEVRRVLTGAVGEADVHKRPVSEILIVRYGRGGDRRLGPSERLQTGAKLTLGQRMAAKGLTADVPGAVRDRHRFGQGLNRSRGRGLRLGVVGQGGFVVPTA
jgi:hypothetical protein